MTNRICFGDSKGGYKKIIWATDLHLDGATKEKQQMFFQSIADNKPDAIFIGGDVCNGELSILYLKQLAQHFKKPIYFVLGNHEFYHESIQTTRTLAKKLSNGHSIIYLTTAGVVEISPSTALIGHDGWADARAGDFLKSTVVLNDYFYIEDLRNQTPEKLKKILHRLGDEAANEIKDLLEKAFESYKKVILLTHVPPFREACVYKGKVANDDWAPHFMSQAVGEAILNIMKSKPNCELLVLCGHTHGAADVWILPNLHVVTGAAEINSPAWQAILQIS